MQERWSSGARVSPTSSRSMARPGVESLKCSACSRISRPSGRSIEGRRPPVSAENWHEERDRLVRLLKAIESGKITHIDEEDLRQLQVTNPDNIAGLKDRLAKLNARLGDKA